MLPGITQHGRLGSSVIWLDKHANWSVYPGSRSDVRRLFIWALGKSICMPVIQRRAETPSAGHQSSAKRATEYVIRRTSGQEKSRGDTSSK